MADDIQERINELKKQQANCLAAAQGADTAIADLLRQQTEAERALDEAIRAGLRTGDETLEEKAREKLLGIDAKLESARARKKLASNESFAVDMELASAVRAQAVRRMEIAKPIIAKIEHRLTNNKSVRSDLIEALALAYVAAGEHPATTFDWSGHLESIIPDPFGQEFADAVAAARKTLGVE